MFFFIFFVSIYMSIGVVSMSKMLQINASNLNSLRNQYSPLNSFYVDENDGTLIFENMRLRQGTCFVKERITAELPPVGLTE